MKHFFVHNRLYPKVLMNMCRNEYESHIKKLDDYYNMKSNYCARLLMIYNKSFLRMIKYHRRGTNVFDLYNINCPIFNMIINFSVVPKYISSYDYDNDKFFDYYFNLQLTEFERNTVERYVL
jgi:hypothetical protein